MSPRAEPRVEPMPMDRAILWNPPAAPGSTSPGKSTTRSPYPIFFQQEAVIALQEHLKSSPTQAVFGFLVGEVFRDPEAGVLYTIIDKTLKLSQAIYGDKTEVVVSRLWDRMQELLAKASASLLGWYHSHPGQGGFLTAHDVETHQKFFTEPWHVAILVAAEAGGVTGRFFRATQNADWHKTPIAFYELLQPESIKPDGKKRSFITWRNYKPYGPTLTGPKRKPPEPPPPPPKAEAPEDEAEEAEVRDAPERTKERPAAADRGFRIMRSSADDIPVIKTSADDEPAHPAPPAPKSGSKTRPSAPVFVPDEPRAAKAPPPTPKPPPKPAPPPPPARSSDDIPWQVSPAEVAASSAPPPRAVPPPAPPPLPPPPPPPLAPFAPPAPPAPRRTPTHTFRLLDEAEEKPAPPPKPRVRRRRLPWRRWLKRAAMLLVLAGAGAGGYWYFAIKNPKILPGLFNSAKQLVSRITTRKPSPPAPPAGRRRPTTSPQPQAAPPTSAAPVRVPVPQPAAAPPAAVPPPPASPFARFDRLSDSLTRAVRNFQDRAALFASGRMDCNGLATGLVGVENLWSAYNVERRARMASFDPRRVAQDQLSYAAVDSVESRFEHSGCPRP